MEALVRGRAQDEKKVSLTGRLQECSIVIKVEFSHLKEV